VTLDSEAIGILTSLDETKYVKALEDLKSLGVPKFVKKYKKAGELIPEVTSQINAVSPTTNYVRTKATRPTEE